MVGCVHADGADCEGVVLRLVHLLLVVLVGALDEGLVGVELVEFREDGVGGEEEGLAAAPLGEVEAVADGHRVVAGDEQVDRLIAAGRKIIRNNPEFQRLVADLGGRDPGTVNAD